MLSRRRSTERRSCTPAQVGRDRDFGSVPTLTTVAALLDAILAA